MIMESIALVQKVEQPRISTALWIVSWYFVIFSPPSSHTEICLGILHCTPFGYNANVWREMQRRSCVVERLYYTVSCCHSCIKQCCSECAWSQFLLNTNLKTPSFPLGIITPKLARWLTNCLHYVCLVSSSLIHYLILMSHFCFDHILLISLISYCRSFRFETKSLKFRIA